ncbi:YncE family protein [Streptomyces sp. NPDC052020]|uniref:YncE family protein n=1 Tax=Streptomyces sp. NPDC052020 TaxID=3155677 RepID=UPI00341837AE
MGRIEEIREKLKAYTEPTFVLDDDWVPECTELLQSFPQDKLTVTEATVTVPDNTRTAWVKGMAGQSPSVIFFGEHKSNLYVRVELCALDGTVGATKDAWNLSGMLEMDCELPVVRLEWPAPAHATESNIIDVQPRLVASVTADYAFMPDRNGVRLTGNPAGLWGLSQSWSCELQLPWTSKKVPVSGIFRADRSSGGCLTALHAADALLRMAYACLPGSANTVGAWAVDDFGLKDLPLVGELIGGGKDEEVAKVTGFRVWQLRAPMPADQVSAFNAAVGKDGPHLPGSPGSLAAGFGITLTLHLGATPYALTLQGDQVETAWTPCDWGLEPFRITGVRLRFDGEACWLLLRARLTLGDFTISSEELGFGVGHANGFDLRPRFTAFTVEVGDAELEFTLDLASGQQERSVTATWEPAADDKDRSLHTVAGKLGIDVPDNLTCSVDELSLSYHFDSKKVGFSAVVTDAKPATLFTAFGIEAPPVLEDLTIERLAVAFDSKGDKFTVDVLGTLPVGAAQARITLAADLSRRTGGGYDRNYSASLGLEIPQDDGTRRVMSFVVESSHQQVFTAAWEDSTGVSLADLAKLCGVQDPATEQVLKSLGTVNEATLSYSQAAGQRRTFVLTMADANGGGLLLASTWRKDAPRAARDWVARVGLGINAGLSDVELLRGVLPQGMDAGLRGVSVLYAAGELSAERIGELNAAVAASGSSLPALPTGPLASGLAFTAEIALPGGTSPQSVTISTRAAPTPTAQAPVSAGTGQAAAGQPPLVAWLPVQCSAGPLSLRRIGVGYIDDAVWVLFDASLGMAGLVFGVQGLGLGAGLQPPHQISVRLDGLTAGYSKPPLVILGALLNRPANDTYVLLIEGAVVIQMREWGVTALAAYARTTDGYPVFFLFGKVSGRFGGPPPLNITGIMAGFGYNTSLRLPAAAELDSFPFLKDPADMGDDPLEVLGDLMTGTAPWVRASADQLWLAAGMSFSLFEFLSCQALLVLELGPDLALALLGTATARFPQDIQLPAYARAGLGLAASFRASQPVVKVTAQLLPGSFLLDENCALTGGFALYLWADKDHAGDFVLTLGGYHSKYQRPSHYPAVPPLGVSWTINDNLSIGGTAYAALTPAAVMAGGALEINYRSGDLHAWLTARTDVLIEWAPFHFTAGVEVTIGVSYLLDLWFYSGTIRTEVGATLNLWGPPTCGKVTVHLWFVDFTVAFGAGTPPQDEPAAWQDVQRQLPAADAAVRLVCTGGLEPAEETPQAGGTSTWVVRPDAFAFTVRTAVPVTTFTFGQDPPPPDKPLTLDGQAVQLRPLRDTGTNLTSKARLLLTHGKTIQPLDDWAPAAVTGDLPAGLWSAYSGPLRPNDPPRVAQQLTGATLTVPPPTEGASPGDIKAGTLAVEDCVPDGPLPLRSFEPSRDLRHQRAAQSVGQLAGQVRTPSHIWGRARLFAAMQALGVCPGHNKPHRAEAQVIAAGDLSALPWIRRKSTREASTGHRLFALDTADKGGLTTLDAHTGAIWARKARLDGSSSAADRPRFAISPDGRRACLVRTNEHIQVWDISGHPTGSVQGDRDHDNLWVPQRPVGVAITPDSSLAVMTFAGSNQVYFINIAQDPPKVLWIAGAGKTITSVSDVAMITPPKNSSAVGVYLTAPAQSQVLYMGTLNVNTKAPHPGQPLTVQPPSRLAVTPDNEWLFALCKELNTVTVIRTGTPLRIAAEVRTGLDPVAVVVAAGGKRLCVANEGSGTVSVIDITDADPKKWPARQVWVGYRPLALAVSPDGALVFIAHSTGDVSPGQDAAHVRVLDVSGNTPALLPVCMPLTHAPVVLAVAPPPPVVEHTLSVSPGSGKDSS